MLRSIPLRIVLVVLSLSSCSPESPPQAPVLARTNDARSRDDRPAATGSTGHDHLSAVEISRRTARLLHEGMVLSLSKDANVCPTFDDLRTAGVIASSVPRLDAWGRELVGFCNDRAMAQVRSAGPDGRFQTSDDIVEGALDDTP